MVVASSSSSATTTIDNNAMMMMFDMDVFELENGQYEIVPSRRKLKKKAPEPNCEPVSECDVCSSGQREKEPLCKDTGRVQRFKCKPEEGDVVEIFKTCKRTIADDEFLMMQMQVFCFFLGSLALLSVRKNRTVSASLFDQRKAARRGSQYPRSDEVEIEFTPMMGQDNTNNEEMQPLRPIDVV